MRGGIWALLVVALGAGIGFRGLSTAQPSAPASSTTAVTGVLSQVEPVAGLLLMLVTIGALFRLTMPTNGGL